ncbi:unnamed protein product [Rotaria sp. Silwood1]|nr:unnamed protein product [Rotaria sp. Silwood1]
MSGKQQTQLLKNVCKRAELMRAPYRQSSWTNETQQTKKKSSLPGNQRVNFQSKSIDSHVRKTSSLGEKEQTDVKQHKQDSSEQANSNHNTN